LSRWLRSLSGAGSSPTGKSGVERRERLLQPYLGRIELAHRLSQPVFGEVGRLNTTRIRDQLHRPHRRLVVALGKHVDVRVGHSLAIHLAGALGQSSVAEPATFHQEPQRLAKWFVALRAHFSP
jgi:hypothetical protein